MISKRQWMHGLLLGLLLGSASFYIGCDQIDQFLSGDGTETTIAQIERGQYLAVHISQCVDCHTPRLPDGRPNEELAFSGGWEMIPGMLWTPNLTSDPETGLGSWTDEQIIAAFRMGRGHFDEDPRGKPLSAVMPYYVYGNITDEDSEAIVAFLRSLPPVKNEVPEPNPQMVPPQPAQVLDYTSLPGADDDPGKYLTSAAGACIECHTSRIATPGPPDPSLLDPAKYFAGGEKFNIPGLQVASANITSDMDTGIGSWTDEQIKAALQQGIDKDGIPLCPPMPSQLLAGLTEEDLGAIVGYLKRLPAIQNEVPDCEIVAAPAQQP